MNICIFGSASKDIDKKYILAGEEMGKKLAKAGYNLVFGGGAEGMMGAAARGFKEGGAYITGIIPEFFKGSKYEVFFEECDETIFTEDISQRIRLMEQMSEAFVVFPGGSGTYEEFFKILVSKSLDRHVKPLALINIDGYYDPLIRLLESSHKEKFITENALHNYRVFDENEFDKLVQYLNE